MSGIPLNLGVRGHDIVAATPAELGENINALGFTCTQLAVKKSFPDYLSDTNALTPGFASYFGNAFAKSNVKIAVLGCYVNISSENLAVRTKAIADFKTHLRLCKEFGAAMVGTETGSVKGGYCTENFTEEAYLVARESIAQMVDYAEQFGATVGIEPGLHHPIYTAQRMRRLLDDLRSPNLKVILDCANLITVENYTRQQDVFHEAFELLGDDVIHMHLKDFQLRSGALETVPVGTGLMDYRPILRFIKRDKPLMFTTLEATREPDIPHALDTISQCYDCV